MSLHPSTFEYLMPTTDQTHDMNAARMAAKDYAQAIETLVPEGPDQTYCLRLLRSLAMWVNVAISRHPDGAPRQ